MSEQRDNHTESSRDRSRTLIRELYQLSEAGAFDNVDIDTVETASNFLMSFLNPTINYKQASKIFGKSEENLRSDVFRKLPPRKKINFSQTFFKYNDLKRILKK